MSIPARDFDRAVSHMAGPVANHLIKFPPTGIVQEEVDRLVESVEAPWGVRYERQIREAMESAGGAAASTAIAETVRRLGLEPFKAPDPLPPIEEQDIRLICWMAVDVNWPVFGVVDSNLVGPSE